MDIKRIKYFMKSELEEYERIENDAFIQWLIDKEAEYQQVDADLLQNRTIIEQQDSIFKQATLEATSDAVQETFNIELAQKEVENMRKDIVYAKQLYKKKAGGDVPISLSKIRGNLLVRAKRDCERVADAEARIDDLHQQRRDQEMRLIELKQEEEDGRQILITLMDQTNEQREKLKALLEEFQESLKLPQLLYSSLGQQNMMFLIITSSVINDQ
ncbi:MAG: hypothetical protein EZS28_021869 [Streblomastix strix]|uniref:Uncharacterized protein n=1 Tax=Streblomastix strix TaxID=222440 RepID=A0A5J4VJD0_9EUKA|nr:MAG: hypothetical protein EZS28_021869 [Streblomastix strix]